MSAPIVFRLIHISDLHFGDSLSRPWSARIAPPGIETHSEPVARDLAETALQIIRADSVPSRVIATGDLTTLGTNAAFQLALTYLRSKIVATAKVSVGFGDLLSAVIPGNHDMWNGAILALRPGGTRTLFETYFGPPAIDAVLSAPTVYFPYRVTLIESPVRIYLYGIDSTCVHLSSQKPKHMHDFLAEGFVDQDQLNALKQMIASETSEGLPCIRLLAIHHPMAYPNGKKPSFKRLINLFDVLTHCRNHRISAFLCGHQHQGFVKALQEAYVLSVGTATQTVHLNRAERRILSRTPSSLITAAEVAEWQAAAAQCNEFRVYEFLAPTDGSYLPVNIRVFRYFPNAYTFQEMLVRGQKHINLRLS